MTGSTTASSSSPVTSATGTGTGTDTDTGSGTGTGTGTDTDTDTSTGGDPLCGMPDPEVDAGFVVDIGAWPVDNQNFFSIEADCTIETMQDGTSVELGLSCSAGKEQLPIALTFAGSSEGAPQLTLGLGVAFRYRYEEDTELGSGTWEALGLRESTGGALLVAGARTGGFTSSEFSSVVPDFDPIVATVDEAYCPIGQFDILPFLVEFSLGEATVEIISGQRGALAVSESEDVYAIDLAEATLAVDKVGDSPPETVSLLIRRVTP